MGLKLLFLLDLANLLLMKVLLLCLYYLVVIHVVCLSFLGVFGVGWEFFSFYLLYGYFVFAFSMLSICF